MTDFDDPNLPLYAGTLRGYRYWHMSDQGFMSVFKPNSWRATPGTANCRQIFSSPPLDHHAPERGCRCGFYAWYTPDADPQYRDDLVSLFGGSPLAFGVISAWGKIIPGTKGFRAEKAKIEAVRLHHPLASWRWMEQHYPGVKFFSTEDEMVAAYPPQPLQPSAIETEKT